MYLYKSSETSFCICIFVFVFSYSNLCICVNLYLFGLPLRLVYLFCSLQSGSRHASPPALLHSFTALGDATKVHGNKTFLHCYKCCYTFVAMLLLRHCIAIHVYPCYRCDLCYNATQPQTQLHPQLKKILGYPSKILTLLHCTRLNTAQ